MKEFPVTLRQSSPGDEKYLLEFTKTDGWDYSEYDVKSALSFDPGFLIVAADHLNVPVGFGGIIDVGSNTMYLDAFIVREDLRHKGIGSKIWKALLERAGQRNIGLDSLLDSIEWYRKQGFIHESFKLHAYCATITSDMKDSFQSTYKVIPLSESLWPCLLDYDKQIFPYLDREKCLRAWNHGATTVLAFLGEDVAGYGFIHKKYDNVYGLRNVNGDNELVVESMLRYLTAHLPDGAELYFTLVDDKPVPKYLSTNCKFHETLQRIFNKTVIKVNCEKVWLTSVTKI